MDARQQELAGEQRGSAECHYNARAASCCELRLLCSAITSSSSLAYNTYIHLSPFGTLKQKRGQEMQDAMHASLRDQNEISTNTQ